MKALLGEDGRDTPAQVLLPRIPHETVAESSGLLGSARI